ncbi:hypothetical protein [Fischerella sp. PCC 9605]|nr:hypothetical protein [Fischerella sp. PCC 9605]
MFLVERSLFLRPQWKPLHHKRGHPPPKSEGVYTTACEEGDRNSGS